MFRTNPGCGCCDQGECVGPCSGSPGHYYNDTEYILIEGWVSDFGDACALCASLPTGEFAATRTPVDVGGLYECRWIHESTFSWSGSCTKNGGADTTFTVSGQYLFKIEVRLFHPTISGGVGTGAVEVKITLSPDTVNGGSGDTITCTLKKEMNRNINGENSGGFTWKGDGELCGTDHNHDWFVNGWYSFPPFTPSDFNCYPYTDWLAVALPSVVWAYTGADPADYYGIYS